MDVREKDEVRAGYIPGAVHIPRGFLEMQAEQKLPSKTEEIIVYCAGGTRSAFAAKTLSELGYENVTSANPIKNSGNPPGPGTAKPTGNAPRMNTQPTTFFSTNQK